MSDFQKDLRESGYEKVVIIAVGQSNISQFNSNFTSNSDLPLVIDQAPNFPIREQFSPNGLHKQVVILGHDGTLLDTYTLNSGLNWTAKNFITNVIAENYQSSISGDINGDENVNIQDIILLTTIILSGESNPMADVNADGIINILDVIAIVNIILG